MITGTDFDTELNLSIVWELTPEDGLQVFAYDSDGEEVGGYRFPNHSDWLKKISARLNLASLSGMVGLSTTQRRQ